MFAFPFWFLYEPAYEHLEAHILKMYPSVWVQYLYRSAQKNPGYVTASFNITWTQVLCRFKSYSWHVRDLWWQGIIQKEKLDISGKKSAQISIVVKKTNTKTTPNYYESQTNYKLQLFCCCFIIMFILCYLYDQKTGIAFTGSYNCI